MIRFETIQFISFILATSLFFYMFIAFLNWFILRCKPKKLPMSNMFKVTDR